MEETNTESTASEWVRNPEVLVGKKLLVLMPSVQAEEVENPEVAKRLRSHAQVEIIRDLGRGWRGIVYEGETVWRSEEPVASSFPDRVAVKIYLPGREDDGRAAFSLIRKVGKKTTELGERIAMPKAFGVIPPFGEFGFAYFMEYVGSSRLEKIKKQFPGEVLPLLSLIDAWDACLMTDIALASTGYYQADRKINDYRFGSVPDLVGFTILDWDLQSYLEPGKRIPERVLERQLARAGTLAFSLIKPRGLFMTLGVTIIDFQSLRDESSKKALGLLSGITDIMPEPLADLCKQMLTSPKELSWEQSLVTLRNVRLQIEQEAERYQESDLAQLELWKTEVDGVLEEYWRGWAGEGKNYQQLARARRKNFLRKARLGKLEVGAKLLRVIEEEGVKALYWRRAVLEATLRKRSRERLREKGINLPEPEEQLKKARKYVESLK